MPTLRNLGVMSGNLKKNYLPICFTFHFRCSTFVTNKCCRILLLANNYAVGARRSRRYFDRQRLINFDVLSIIYTTLYMYISSPNGVLLRNGGHSVKVGHGLGPSMGWVGLGWVET